MRRGVINHIDLTVTDPACSVAFYDWFLGALGYVRGEVYAGGIPNWTLNVDGVSLSLGLHPAKRAAQHDRYSPGLHHLAFHAENRREVDRIALLAVANGAVVLDSPAEYDYTPGYYAAFFADPDGLKLEVVYEPRFDDGVC